MLQLAVLASGNGSNFQAILDKIGEGHLQAQVRLLLCNKSNAYALERAKAAGIPSLFLDPADFVDADGKPDRPSFDMAMVQAIKAAGADTVALAGYMRLLTSGFLEAFAGRVINIHPAILPSFAGLRGAADAQAYGVTITGCTVHLVDEKVDHGAIIIQAAVPSIQGESLEELKNRIHAVEHRIYPQALQWFAEGRLYEEGRTIRLKAAVPEKECIISDGSWLVQPPLERGF